MLHKYHTFSSLLKIGSALLSPSPSNQLDAQILLCKAAGLKKEYLIAHHTDQANNLISRRYFYLIGKRRRRMPLAYILGEKDFYNLKFKVNSSVLIPRPETEGLIELALKYLDDSQVFKVIDLGTGSGCIAISLAKSTPKNVLIDAIDISRQALIIARSNAKKILGKDYKRIRFRKFNYLTQEFDEKYNLIIANPPYVPIEDKHKLEKDISFEPQTAIFAKNKGLQYYYAIKNLLLNNLSISGIALIEIGIQSKQDLYEIFGDSFKIDLKQDLSGNNRYLIIAPLS